MKTSEKGHVDQEFTKPKYSFSPKMTSDDKLSTLNEERQNLGEIIEKENGVDSVEHEKNIDKPS